MRKTKKRRKSLDLTMKTKEMKRIKLLLIEGGALGLRKSWRRGKPSQF